MLRTRIGFVASLAVLGFALGCKDTRTPQQTQPFNPNRGEVPEVEGPPPTPAEREEALKRLDKAVVAHGGAGRVAKLGVVVQKLKGSFRHPTLGMISTDQELKIQMPDRIRLDFKFLTPTGTETHILAMRESRGWCAPQSIKQDLSDGQIADMLGELYLRRVLTLLPLRDEEFRIKPIDGIEVGGRKTAGIRVTHKDWPGVNLYFDNESWLLVKIAGRYREAGTLNMREIIFSDFTAVDGVQVASRLFEVHNGTRFQECEVQYSFPAKINEREFENP
jgi:hypothetical protein